MNSFSDLPPNTDSAAGEAADGQFEVGDAKIFPLPLVPFERYMLADDRRGYPMTFFCRIECEGVPDRSALDAAFAEALKRHPLLTARVIRRGMHWYWVPADGPPPQLGWHMTAAEPPWPASESLNIRRGAGVRGRVHVSAGKSTLVILFHHAACDGIGAFRFIGDVLAYYGRRTARSENQPLLLPISAAHLRYRDQFDIRLPEPVSPWVAWKSLLREFWKVMTRRPLVLGNKHRPSAEARHGRPTLSVDYLAPDLYRRFCARASEQNVTANDLLLRDMFLTSHRWNVTYGGNDSRGWLRINMPTSLRGKRDTRMPATNTLGYALVTQHTDQCEDPQRLLATIAAETLAIRTWSLGAIFVQVLRSAGRIPGLIRFGSGVGRRFSTLVLSNLGDPSRRFRARFPHCGGEILAGNLKVTSMFGAPPIRPGTRAAVALFSYADRLAMALHADPRWFSAEDAQRFLVMYRAQLEHTAETPHDG